MTTQHSFPYFRFQRFPARAARVALALILACLLGASAGCAAFSKSMREDSKELLTSNNDLVTTATLDKTVYRPGEAVVIAVTLKNTTKKPITARRLDTASLSFWFGPREGGRRVERKAVVSRQEEAQLRATGGDAGQIGPGEVQTRRFVLTRFTHEAGDFVAQVQMDPYPSGVSNRSGKVYSEPVEYRVTGKKLFDRDNEGLISKQDAIAIASAAEAGGKVTGSDGILIVDPAGFLKHHINIYSVGEDGGPGRQGYLIDPYFGRVWERCRPFDIKEPEETRRSSAPVRDQPSPPPASIPQP